MQIFVSMSTLIIPLAIVIAGNATIQVSDVALLNGEFRIEKNVVANVLNLQL
jgi:hypothetical protein